MKKTDRIKKEKAAFKKNLQEIEPFIKKRFTRAPSTAGKWETSKPKTEEYQRATPFYSFD